MNNYLITISWFFTKQIGINPRQILNSIKGIPRFINNYYKFKNNWQGKISLKPCLYDWNGQGGNAKSEYFLQDLVVARKIYVNSPKKHIDIGSRIDGFVANVASFREIEVFDIRETQSTIPGITFLQADLMQSHKSQKNYCDSVSCLHALEHFGLGRYGDPLDPDGYKKALVNLRELLTDQGNLYLSVPIGEERVEFNAHRIFNPITFVVYLEELGFSLQELFIISDGSIKKINAHEEDIKMLSKKNYSLGLFILKKGNK